MAQFWISTWLLIVVALCKADAPGRNNVVSPATRLSTAAGLALTEGEEEAEYEEYSDSAQVVTDTLAFRRRVIEKPQPGKVPFGVGEKFEFSLEYGPVKAGTAILEIANIEIVDGHPCYKIHSLAQSSKTFSFFFRVHDEVFSYMDIYELFSRRFQKKLEEGKYRAKQEISFDHNKRIATYHNGKQYEIQAKVHDILSAFYFSRALDLQIGQEIAIETHADRKNYPLLVKVHRKEHVSVPAGEFDCIVVEPKLRTPGIFKQKGTLLVWLTDDAQRIPVLMKSKVFIGSIEAKLRTYQLGIKQQQ